MANQRNALTTHPRKTARRARAALRFTVKAASESDNGYRLRKMTEAASLGLAFESVRRV